MNTAARLPAGPVPLSDAPRPEAASPGAAEQHAGIARRYGVVVGGERLLLDGSGAVRVLDAVPVFRLPNTQHWFAGLANVRGNLVPVFDLARWQGLPAPDTGRMLLVVGADDMAAATLVDQSPRNLFVPDTASPLPAISAGFAAHAKAAFAMGDGIWTELDWDELFQELKLAAVISGGGP